MSRIYIYLIVLIVFIVLIASVIFAGKTIIKLNDKIDNLETTVLQTDSTNKQIVLSNEMFKRVLQKQLDSIEKKTGVKPNKVTNITEIHQHYYKKDSNIYIAPMLSSKVFDISTGDTCWGFNGNFNIETKEVLISEKWSNNNTTLFGYYQRDRLWNVSWFPRWGTKRNFLGSFSDCGSKTEVTEYKIDKK